MAREGYNATVHTVSGRVFEIITEVTHTKDGLLYFMGENPNDEDEDDEIANWNSFLRIPIANIDYIEEEPVRSIRRGEDYGIVRTSVSKVARTKAAQPESGGSRLKEIE